MGKILLGTLVYAVTSVYYACFGGVLHKWTTETSEISSESIVAYHGETLELQCKMLSYNRTIPGCGQTEFLWQTNGMGELWWKTNATFNSSTAYGTFSPNMDAGASEYVFFFRVVNKEGASYRANGTISMMDSPGWTPGIVAPPIRVLDFATIAVTNADKSPFELKGSGGGGGTSTNEVNKLIDIAVGGTNRVKAVVDTVEQKSASWDAKIGVEVDPTVGLTNGTIYIHGNTISPITEHQSLAFTNDYASKIWVTNKEYVTKSVTNNLASEGWVLNKNYVTKEITNGLVTASITNGLVSTNALLNYATRGKANDIAFDMTARSNAYALAEEAPTNSIAYLATHTQWGVIEEKDPVFQKSLLQTYWVSGLKATNNGNPWSLVFGNNAWVSNQAAYAIGNSARVNVEGATSAGGAMQLGAGINKESSSLQFRGTKIVNNEGKIPFASLEQDAITNMIKDMLRYKLSELNAETSTPSNIVMVLKSLYE